MKTHIVMFVYGSRAAIDANPQSVGALHPGAMKFTRDRFMGKALYQETTRACLESFPASDDILMFLRLPGAN
jgi:hypothetical protein